MAELLKATERGVPLEIRIDSRYAMRAVTEWLPKQRQGGYTTVEEKPIRNRDLIVHIDELLSGRASPSPGYEHTSPAATH